MLRTSKNVLEFIALHSFSAGAFLATVLYDIYYADKLYDKTTEQTTWVRPGTFAFFIDCDGDHHYRWHKCQSVLQLLGHQPRERQGTPSRRAPARDHSREPGLY